MGEQFDARGLTCPLAFVLIKQQLIKNNCKLFLLDDKVSCDNLTQYLQKNNLKYSKTQINESTQIQLL